MHYTLTILCELYRMEIILHHFFFPLAMFIKYARPSFLKLIKKKKKNSCLWFYESKPCFETGCSCRWILSLHKNKKNCCPCKTGLTAIEANILMTLSSPHSIFFFLCLSVSLSRRWQSSPSPAGSTDALLTQDRAMRRQCLSCVVCSQCCCCHWSRLVRN